LLQRSGFEAELPAGSVHAAPAR
ncbi:MAG: hypothetical protein RL087_1797, partial [Pseudomonadota bacterium]